MHNADPMVQIPPGPFLYGSDRAIETIELPYAIDIYPVTCKQYGAFLHAGGYDTEALWSNQGWRWIRDNNISHPRLWDDERWHQPAYPVVGVSYHEAEAFAAWSGKRLPTEKEWERAARGTDGRQYPWAGAFDKEKCNIADAGIAGTTPVDCYPSGISPVGCYDMAGNVWEWTSTPFDSYGRVVKGGSWGFYRNRARCCDRFDIPPNFQIALVGFRCAKTALPSCSRQ